MFIANGNVVCKLSDGTAKYVAVVQRGDIKLYKRRDGSRRKDEYKQYEPSGCEFILKDFDRNLVALRTRKCTQTLPLSTFQDKDHINVEDSDDEHDPMKDVLPPKEQPPQPKPTFQQSQTGQQRMVNQWFGPDYGNAPGGIFGPQPGGNVVPGTNIGNAGPIFAPQPGGNVVPGTNIGNTGPVFAPQPEGNVIPGTNIGNTGNVFGPQPGGNTIPGTNIGNVGPIFARQPGGNVIPGTNIKNVGPVFGGAIASNVYALQNGIMPPVASKRYAIQQGQPTAAQYDKQQQLGDPIGIIKNNSDTPMTISAGFTSGNQTNFVLKFPDGTFQALPGKKILPGSSITFQMYAGNSQKLSQITGRTGVNTNSVYVSNTSIPIGMGGYFTLPPRQQVYVYSA